MGKMEGKHKSSLMLEAALDVHVDALMYLQILQYPPN